LFELVADNNIAISTIDHMMTVKNVTDSEAMRLAVGTI